MDTLQPTGESQTPTRRERGAFNKAYLAELDETDDIVRAAQKAEYASVLADFDITAAQVSELKNSSETCRDLLGRAQTGHDNAQSATSNKEANEAALIAAIRRVQSGARLKYDGETANLNRYFIGVPLEKNEARLEQIAQTILQNLQSETLPGVKAAQTTALQSALTDWQQQGDTQSDSKTAATGDQTRAVALLLVVKRAKRQIQIAADGAYPYTNPNSATARRDFHLPC